MARNAIVTGNSALLVDSCQQSGPFCDTNDNVYALVQTTSNSLDIYKATDPTAGAWTAQDTSNNPSDATDGINKYAGIQDGDTIHIAIYWQRPGDDEIRYYTYRMSDHASPDTWNIDETIETPTDPPGSTSQHLSIATRSDGDIVVLYTGDRDKVMGIDYDRCDYARKEGTWTVGVNVGGDSLEANHTAAAADRAESDRIWFTYVDKTNNDYFTKDLSSTNVLGSQQTVTASLVATGESAFGQKLIYYDDSGVEVVYAVYMESGALKSRVLRDGTLQSAVDVASDENTSSYSFALAVDGTVAYCVYKDTDSDLRVVENDDEGGWGSSTELHAGGAFYISANVINHGSNVVGVVWYDSNATTGAYYSEFALPAPPAAEKSGRMTLLGVQ